MRLLEALKYIALSSLVVACSTDAQTIDGLTDTGTGKADQISGNDDPSGLLSNAERQLDKLISADDVGQTFGVDDDLVPYPDTYWPMVDNGIAVEWLEKQGFRCDTPNECRDPQPSPLAKWMAMVNPAEAGAAKDWEVANHGKDVPDVADWFGHCPGWVAGTLLNGPINDAVHVKFDGSKVLPCEDPDEAGCTRFEIGDINALTAEVHEGARSRFIGARCDTEPDEVETDEFGRIVRNGTGCKGLNAGALLIVLGNQLKMNQKPFAIDAQNEFTTEQIWNQPAYRYTVNLFETLTESEAANLVATGGESKTGEQTDYIFNSNAKGFVLVDISLRWVSEVGPNLSPISGLESTHITRMKAVIELDGAGLDSEIIGGEYLDDPSVGANRLRVHPFAWLAVEKGPDFRHNPFVSGTLVQQLIDIARAGGTGTGGGGGCAHAITTSGGALSSGCDAGGDDCVSRICAADSFCCNNSWDSICVGEVGSICGL